MKASPELHELIQSLSQTEKRYFKIVASRHTIRGNNNYVRLFNAIEKQKKYDEEEIKRLFEKEKFIKHLPSEKNYLYALLLDSLHAYHLNLSWDSYIKKQLHEVSIVFEKGLYDHCLKLLSKLKEKCLELEKYTLLIEVFNWQKKIIAAISFKGVTKEEMEKFYQEEQVIIDYINNVQQYENLRSKLGHLFSLLGPPRKSHERNHFNEVMHHPFLKNENYAICHQSKWLFNHIHTVYTISTGNYDKAYTYSRNCVKLIEMRPLQIKEDPNQYIASLNNLLPAVMERGYEKEFFETIGKLRNITANHKIKLSMNQQVNIFLNSYVQEVNYYFTTATFHKINDIIAHIEEGLDSYARHCSEATLRLFYYNLAYTFFAIGEYKKALKWLNKISISTSMDVRSDINVFSKMLGVLVHYELQNFDILGYVVKSTYHFLKRKKDLHESEEIILNTIRKLPEVKSNKELIQLFKNVKEQFVRISKNPEEKLFLNYFDWIAWLDSKINKTDFATAYRLNHQVSLEK